MLVLDLLTSTPTVVPVQSAPGRHVAPPQDLSLDYTIDGCELFEQVPLTGIDVRVSALNRTGRTAEHEVVHVTILDQDGDLVEAGNIVFLDVAPSASVQRRETAYSDRALQRVECVITR